MPIDASQEHYITLERRDGSLTFKSKGSHLEGNPNAVTGAPDRKLSACGVKSLG
jgi:hypothetical protein